MASLDLSTPSKSLTICISVISLTFDLFSKKKNYVRFWGASLYMSDHSDDRETLAGWYLSNRQLLRFVTDRHESRNFSNTNNV